MGSRKPEILVTGATGFLGRAVVERLSDDGRVIAIARDASRAPALRGVDWIEADLRSPLTRARLPGRIGAVVHLASVRVPSPGAGPEELFAVNAGATAALVEYAIEAGATRFVYGSTGGVCGYRRGAIRESATPAPFDLYTMSKWHGETVVARERRLSSAIVRYFFPYGPGQQAGIVPQLASRLRAGSAVTLYRQGRVPHLNPVFVDDAAELTRLAMSSSKTILVNCAGREVVTVKDLARLMAAVIGVSPRFVNGQDPKVGDMVASLGLSARTLKFAPRVPLDVGLQRTLESSP